MKKTMKTLLVLSLVVVMMFSLAACGGDKDADKATLTMATNAYFPPYEYYDGENIVGIDAEIAQAIADKLDMNLEIVDIEFDSIVSGVATGKYDMGMAGMTVTEDRLESVDFTDSYATGRQVIIVAEGSPITSPDDLFADGATYTVGVQLGTTGDIYTSDDLGADRVKQFNSGNEAVEALKSGKVDCVVIDNEPAKYYVDANEGLEILPTEYVTEDYSICIAKDNSELKDKIKTALNELMQDGTVQEIIDKYISAE